MRHRIVGQRFYAISHGFHARQIQTQSTISQRLSITASPKVTQRQILDELKKHTLKAKERADHEAPETNGIAILASKNFTSWLEDQNFMSAFLETLLNPESTAPVNGPSLHVLSGITDGLSPHRLCSEPRSGFSVLRGPVDNILPELWEKESISGASQDSAACVSFTANPLTGNTSALEVTLPLANTVFQNGRRSTLYASRWDTASDGRKTLGKNYPKTTQRIIANGSSVNHTSSIIPLLPLTPPRRIVAGLGNIVRQVEIDGCPTPASKELETIIPQIFEERARREPRSSPRPIGVWCWVIPHHIGPEKFNNLKLFKAGSSLTEAEIALDSIEVFSALLSSGCRLHKILSGGGGWGLKQGLLSLDPETSFPLPGQDDDMEMFIKSFQERNSAEPTGGLATPGSSLLFCVEPQVMNIEDLSRQLPAPKDALSFGVSPSLDDTPSSSSPADPVDIIDGHFGISSATGLFLRTNGSSIGTGNNNDMQGASQGSFTTKVDVPGAYFYV
ncbi:hypothetical protein O1611_g8780 [Lasiodiplodia mahajangana]|uniref:Uncharacterized protein n=1 Tax=Lasiodiplodia mahajangana TaxID=1108764 RepID=A0ACC2JBV6_9PEZI|nr:hypothetical protein O1611_g8780 [Lasiodiplodia mahajangana]